MSYSPHILLLFFVTVIPMLSAEDYDAFVYAGCSQPRYSADSPYSYDVDSLLTSIANSAASTSYSSFTSSSASALFQCRADLPASACALCIRTALSRLSFLCPYQSGAALQLAGCFLRYGNDSFLGKPDTTLMYKKCGGGEDEDADVIGMRDSAVGEVAAAEGAYRVGSAGQVRAVAQCVEDVGEKGCGDCVAAAAAQVKVGCAYKAEGEVYLGKCYVRCWSDGGGDGVYSSSSSYVGRGKWRLMLTGGGLILCWLFLL
ncbi:plasmodesmata-located protein 6-like [Typha angustifolia]|uniref:plasmodesmata-located protein 6-like n=1 Tax=Typha angustifolia TaxID=59011 RepID=UPI003C2D3E56